MDDKTSSGFTHHDAKKWSLELIEEAISHKKNIVLDQTSADFQTLKIQFKISEIKATKTLN